MFAIPFSVPVLVVRFLVALGAMPLCLPILPVACAIVRVIGVGVQNAVAVAVGV